MGCPRSRLLCSHVHHRCQPAAHPSITLVAAGERSVGDAPAGKRELDVLVALQDFFGGDDNSGTPMDAARGPPPSTMDSNDAAGSAFDELRGMIRERVKGAARFDHDHFSK